MEVRVFGPPGTGKTTYLGEQIGNAAAKRGSDQILAASFTRAAAKELISRELPVSEDRIGTLHSLCFRALGRPPVIYDKVKEWNDLFPYYALPNKSGRGMEDAMDSLGGEMPGEDLMNAVNLNRALLRPKSIWRPDVAQFSEKWEWFKASHGAIDYTDMIDRCLKAQVSPTGSPKIAFFDEVQDFSALELSLVREWSKNFEETIMAGDDDQAIYGFAGASPDAFLKPEVPDRQKRFLTKSYRLPKKVHEYAAKWVEQIGFREPKDFHPRDDEQGSVSYVASNWRSPWPIIESAIRDAQQGRSVMLLGACAYMLRPMMQLLRDEGQPYGNQYRRDAGHWNPLTPRGVSTSKRMLAYLRLDSKAWGEETRMWTEADIALFAPLLKKDAFRRGIKAKLAKGADDRRELTVEQMLKYLTEEALWAAMDSDLGWFEKNLLDSKRKSAEFPIKVYKKHGGDALKTDPKITIGTIHSVKGGEADSVYLLPDLSQGFFEQWRYGNADDIYRMMYVGISRARSKLQLCAPLGNLAIGWL